MHANHANHFNLVAAAHAAMIENGFQPDFPAGTDTELAAIEAQPAPPAADGIADLRNLLWSADQRLDLGPGAVGGGTADHHFLLP